jgi:uncharacterized protein (DUF1501 family)
MSIHYIDRRSLLRGAGAAAVLGMVPGFSRVAFANAPTDKRFVVVILRGALDGLTALAPLGDPAYEGLRGELALEAGGARPALKLDGLFSLHPDLPGFKAAFDAGQMAAFHAVAIPVRERSHFEAQAILETGLGRAGGTDGWLNRAIGAMGWSDAGKSIAFSAAMPLLLQGNAPASSFTPTTLTGASDDFMDRMAALYAADPALGPALAKGREVQMMASDADGGNGMAGNTNQRQANMVPIAEAAAKMLARPDGPRIAVLEAYGWDTHVGQGAADGTLARRLANLDAAMTAFQKGLGAAWNDTVVTIVTEFGRTARPNGNKGTDHGTGAAAFLIGGAVKGGMVTADWPGLSDAKLFENRDLAATCDVRSVLKGALAGHMGIDPGLLDAKVFPDSGKAPALEGVIRA